MTYYVAGLPYSAELYHYGILGQKWGVRRYQNPDGTRTQAGKVRYRDGGKVSSSDSDSSDRREKLKKAAKIALITAGTAAAAYGTYRLAKSGAFNDLASNVGSVASRLKDKASKKASDSAKKTADRNLRDARAKVNSDRLKDAVNSFNIPDEELLNKIGRLEKEAQYRKLVMDSIEFQAKHDGSAASNATKQIFIDAGKKVAGTFIAGAGTYAIKSLLTKKFDPKDAADYVAPKPKKK